jgi:ribosomal protein S18 acetylase RimI-like enzyme
MANGCPPDPHLSLRAAKDSDVTCLSHLARASMPDDPSWDFRHTHWLRYPDDHSQWLQKEFKDYFDQPDRYHIDVVVAADNEGGSDVPISFAIWVVDHSVPANENDVGVPFDRSQLPRRRDIHPVHFRAFREQLPAGDDAFFGHYNSDRLQLFVLGTHPLFRRRGAASMLVRTGLERAKSQEVPTTVVSGTVGRPLFSRLGFATIGRFRIHVSGDEQQIHMTAMEHRGDLGPPAGKRKYEEHLEAERSGTYMNGQRRWGSPPSSIDDFEMESMDITLEMAA